MHRPRDPAYSELKCYTSLRRIFYSLFHLHSSCPFLPLPSFLVPSASPSTPPTSPLIPLLPTRPHRHCRCSQQVRRQHAQSTAAIATLSHLRFPLCPLDLFITIFAYTTWPDSSFVLHITAPSCPALRPARYSFGPLTLILSSTFLTTAVWTCHQFTFPVPYIYLVFAMLFSIAPFTSIRPSVLVHTNV